VDQLRKSVQNIFDGFTLGVIFGARFKLLVKFRLENLDYEIDDWLVGEMMVGFFGRAHVVDHRGDLLLEYVKREFLVNLFQGYF
jgi:hypothetical protein